MLQGYLNPRAKVADDVGDRRECGERKNFFKGLVFGHAPSKPFEGPFHSVETTIDPLLTFCYNTKTGDNKGMDFGFKLKACSCSDTDLPLASNFVSSKSCS